MLLLVFAGLGVLVSEDEVDLQPLLAVYQRDALVSCDTLFVAPHLSGPNMIM